MNTTIKLSKFLSIDIRQHLLIVGQTGSGKSLFVNYMILQYAKIGAEIYVADPKHADLWLIDKIKGFPEEHVGTTPAQIAKILRLADEKMQQRYEKYFVSIDDAGKDFTDFGLAPIFIIIDEFSAFAKTADKKTLEEAKRYLFDITMRGRQAGVLIGGLIMQRPDANLLDGAIRDQMGCRLALGKLSPEGYRMIFGRSDIISKSITEKGGGYIMIEGQTTEPIYYETPWISESFNFLKELSNFYQ
ncbi:MAG: DUF87 domain-containing protein [Streptococcus gallolyticus]|uniref:DUF87 domain-containing protein n=1 Tax=Streptococcus gallolyticus TaxID=315405 RepID=A0A927XKA5_9STRE|nr:DUF87 domain-containing protein [Streptococcus gallolyticus]